MEQSYFNPYSSTGFFSFFIILLKRLFLFLTGNLSFDSLATDEVQVLVLIGVSLSGAVVGTFLVLRKSSMLANALSHTLLLGIVVTFLFLRTWQKQIPTIMSLPALMMASVFSAFLTTFLTESLSKFFKLDNDSSIGLVFSTLFALGVVLVTLYTRNVHVGIELVMGNADALQRKDIQIVYLMFLLNVSLLFCFFKEFLLTTFDPQLARCFGVSLFFFNMLLMIQTSFTAIAAFRCVGFLMVLAFFVAPVLTARFWVKSLCPLIVLSMVIGAFASVLGVAISRSFYNAYGFGISTGGIVVMVLALLFVVSAFSRKFLKASVTQLTLRNFRDILFSHEKDSTFR